MDRAVGQVIAQTQAQQRNFQQRLRDLDAAIRRVEEVADRLDREYARIEAPEPVKRKVGRPSNAELARRAAEGAA